MQRPADHSESDFTPQGESEPGVRHQDIDDDVESVVGAPAIAGRTTNDSRESMALSITCHAQITNLEGWKYLACGVDTLELGVYVQWGEAWEQQKVELDEGKAKAAGTEGIPLNDWQFLILPSGRRPNYRWQLQWADLLLCLSQGREPHGDTPNVYAKISSEALWRNGVEGAVALVVHEIECLGGQVQKIKPSRCDLAADFWIPDGIPLDLLMSLRVPADGAHVHHMKGDRLETFYQGTKSSPIQMRIYDKALEVQKGGTKLWFLDIWDLPTCESVWRVEFQIRRTYLKEFGIDTVPELLKALPGLWKRLTEDWFSLRLHDASNVSRRTVHPWWLGVQCCDVRFGEPQPLVRKDEQSPADASWYVPHGAGMLMSYAVRRRLSTFEMAASEYVQRMGAYWSRKGFDEAYATRSIQLGFVNFEEGPSSLEPDGREAA